MYEDDYKEDKPEVKDFEALDTNQIKMAEFLIEE
jgi:hypothetical protein